VITGIVVALREELSTLTTEKAQKGVVLWLHKTVCLVYSGAGAENAASAAETLVKHGATQLISWGCAAGIDEVVQPGDLILAAQCVNVDNDVFNSDCNWLDRIKVSLPKSIKVYNSRIAESKAVVASSAEKVKIAKATGAVALDMESSAIAKVAQDHGLPFLIIRAVADPLAMALPNAVSYALDNQGEVNLARLLGYLSLHPFELPTLIRLGLHFNSAKATLKLLAKQLEAIVNCPKPD
jgi:adenosylhomocysteine nucleosidase